MKLKVSICQGQKEPPKGCTHAFMNTIKEVYDWYKVEGDVAYMYLDHANEWHDSQHKVKDLLKWKRFIFIGDL